jgi:hypothetical protein
VGTTWLVELLAPFAGDPLLAGVFGSQVPRPRCNPATSRDVAELFSRPPPGFFSNVCSAVRRSALERVPFRDVDYAEDRAFAADAAAVGLRIAYAPAARVLHSHDLRLGAYFRRMFDEARGVRQVGGRTRTGAVWLLAATARGTLKDWRFVAGNREYSAGAKLRWVVTVPMYNVARRLAIWLAGRSLPGRAVRFLSLDTRRREIAAG